jgi:BirA family transcriptional regulator, biotin operon repressor / biotin---[acetyl-CoA-carboxylase] ligase
MIAIGSIVHLLLFASKLQITRFLFIQPGDSLKSYFRYGQKYKCLITCNAMISIGDHLTVLQSVDSTNNYAMARVRAGLAKHGDAFFALEQLDGKGQRGSAWHTEPGNNIILSVVLRPQQLRIMQQFSLNIAVALAAYDFFACHAGDETKIKWPNDIYWRDRKAGGMLIENIIGGGLTDDSIEHSTAKNKWQWAIIGIGININQTLFPDILINPVSLKQITGKEWNVIELAKDLCACLQKRYNQLLQNQDLLTVYNQHLYKHSQVIRLKKGTRVFEATVKGVNAAGLLTVIGSMEEQFKLGEIEWLL